MVTDEQRLDNTPRIKREPNPGSQPDYLLWFITHSDSETIATLSATAR